MHRCVSLASTLYSSTVSMADNYTRSTDILWRRLHWSSTRWTRSASMAEEWNVLLQCNCTLPLLPTVHPQRNCSRLAPKHRVLLVCQSKWNTFCRQPRILGGEGGQNQTIGYVTAWLCIGGITCMAHFPILYYPSDVLAHTHMHTNTQMHTRTHTHTHTHACTHTCTHTHIEFCNLQQRGMQQLSFVLDQYVLSITYHSFDDCGTIHRS